MTSYRAGWTRFLLRHSFGRKYREAGSSIEKIRRLDDLLIRSQRPPRGTHVSAVEMNGLSGEWVLGPGARSGATILHLHGGAFVSGSPATHRELVARISASAGVRALSVDYRLAPEHPFPAALEDVVAAYLWLLDQGSTPAHLVLGGESSGGGLALQALLSMKRDGIPLPCAAFFLSPVTDWVGLDGESYATRAEVDPLVSPSQCRFTASQYLGDHPRDAPLLRPAEMDLDGLPPMWIQVGDHEVLLSDAQRLARRAESSGVDVDFKVWPGLWHVFQGAARVVPEARASIEELGRFVRERLETESA
jgi:monoterpene epsilon-lactone hydrolase